MLTWRLEVVWMLTVLVASVIATESHDGNMTYMIVAPKVLRPGAKYDISVNIFKSSDTVDITAKLLDSENSTITQNYTEISPGAAQILSLEVPDALSQTSYVLDVTGSRGLSFHQSATVDVKTKTLSLFVQTDKAIYKPGQTVHYRVIAVYPTLKPFKGPVDVAIFDNAGNKILQLLKQVNETGVIGGELALSDQSPLGDWKIEVKAAGNTNEKKFEVAEYVLPKFKVSVDLPSYYLVNYNQKSVQEELTVSVSAKYTYGQMVKGKADVRIQLEPYYYDSTVYPHQLYTVNLEEGKATLKLSIDKLVSLVPASSSMSDRWQSLAYRSILVVANVTEMATGKVLSSNASVSCKSENYQLKFLDISPDSYKLHLVYTGFLQLSQMDDSVPLTSDVGSLVTLTISSYRIGSYEDPVTEKLDLSVPKSGLMPFHLSLTHINTSSVHLRAEFKDPKTTATVTTTKQLSKFESRDNEAIQVSLQGSTDSAIKADQVVTMNVKTTTPITTFSYQVLSKGAIVVSNTVTGERSLHHQITLTMTDRLAQLLSPNARVIVWCQTQHGEVITDSLELTVDGAFANQVSLAFNKAEVRPADEISLTVNAHQGSFIGLLAVDKSVQLLKGGNDITQNMVLDELKEYDSTNRRFRPVLYRCYWPIFSGGQTSAEVFENAGVLTLTDGFIDNRPVYPYWSSNGVVFEMAAAPGAGLDGMRTSVTLGGFEQRQQPVKVRSEFPETWLWSDMKASASGSVTINAKAPDTMTSWIATAFAVSDDVGLGVAPTPSELTVFQPFFVQLNLPYSVIRGEEFALQVTVFNFISSELQVTVTLKKSSDFMVRHENSVEPEQVELQQTVVIAASDAKTVYFWVVPRTLGQVPIEVNAVSTVAGDAERRMLLVKPEGTRQEYSTSVFLDLTQSIAYNTTLDVSLPPTDVVPGSQYLEVTVIGDLLGPSINGLDSLIQMPYGCGEQNMLNFAPNIYIMKYLSTSSQLTSAIADKSKRFMLAGYQRELTYQRDDGSFSAFGNSDPAGSIWLSSFVAKCFHEAKDYVPVEDGKIANTLQWILNQQSQNGSFREPGRVIHTDMQGGSANGVSLTAYVLIALLENKNNKEIKEVDFLAARTKAISYLEHQLNSVTDDPYALSIISYALTLAGSQRAASALRKLQALAIAKDGLTHWEKKESEKSQDDGNVWRPPYSQARSVNIEMTSYAMLTYVINKDVSGAVPIAKWIVAQRNPNGGFSSTQDTVMALQALAAFASLTSAPSGGDSQLQLKAIFGSTSHDFVPITRQNALVLQSVQIPSNVSSVQILATGQGSGLVQLNVKYNVYNAKNNAGVVLALSTSENDKELSLVTCGRWTKQDEPSGMVVMDISQLTGYTAVNLDDVRQQVGSGLKRVENDDNKIVLYFDELTGSETCLTLKSEKTQMVTNVQKAAVKLYSYYDPTSAEIEFYKPPEASAMTDRCKACIPCCSLDEPHIRPINAATRLLSAVTSLAGFGFTLTVAGLLSCIILV